MCGRKTAVRFLSGLLLFAVLTGFFGTGAYPLLAAEDREKEMFFCLTQEEEDYLARLRGDTLFLGVCEAGIWEEDGAAGYGPAAPLLDVLRYEFGLKIKVVQGTWEEYMAALRAGELDFLIGVPADWQEETEDSEEPYAPENGIYCSAWLYENPYILVEYANGSPAAGRKSEEQKDAGEEEMVSAEEDDRADGEDSELDRSVSAGENSGKENPEQTDNAQITGTVVAYVAGDPAAESILPFISNILPLYTNIENPSGTQTNSGPSFLPCQEEDAVFAALENGSAAAGILPEDALFARYPAADFSAAAALSQYGSTAALGTANEALRPLLAILGRYLDATQEGDQLRAAIREQKQSIRQEKIRKQEQKLLEALQKRGKELQYAQAGLDAVPFFWHDESGAHGELPDFLAFVEECTGLALKERTCSGEEALQALEDGELFFVSGMPSSVNGQEYCHAGMYRKNLVPVVLAADAEQFAKMEKQGMRTAIAHRYWGAAQEFMPLIAGTAFDGHTVGFSDEKKLYEAMSAGEIGGMLIGEESFDALLLSGECPYAVVEGIAFPVRCGLAFSGTDADAAELFMRLWQLYGLLHRRTESAAGQYRTAYAQAGAQQEKLMKIVWVSGAAALVFAAAAILAGAGHHKSKKKM